MRKRFSACGSTRRAEDNEKSAVLSFSTIIQLRTEHESPHVPPNVEDNEKSAVLDLRS